MPIIYILLFMVIIGIIAFIANAITLLAVPIGITLLLIGLVYSAYQIYAYLYFKGEKFKTVKESIKKHIEDCNELNNHIEELKSSYSNIKSFEYGESRLYDNSNYKFKRTEWNKNIKNQRVHNCSATVCKNASDQPFKYLCKYFDIKTTEETLSSLEVILNNFAAAEQGKVLLENEKNSILNGVSNLIPPPIFRFSNKTLTKKLGFEPIDLSNLYFPIYTFQYVSAGGNSSSKCDIKLNIDNLDKFIQYLSELVKFKNSIAGQRALMTSTLREKIKSRDSYTCRHCSLSIMGEKNLLLEIDHIIPLSKGGITAEDNLQTLCWKCNRSKGAKII